MADTDMLILEHSGTAKKMAGQRGIKELPRMKSIDAWCKSMPPRCLSCENARVNVLDFSEGSGVVLTCSEWKTCGGRKTKEEVNG